MNTIKDTPLISIIISVYNVENHVGECIDSVLDQKIPLEIILIDDGCTDRSGKILHTYSKKNNNIKLVHLDNQGLCATRNYGLQIASGEYIVFLNSNDKLKKDSLSVLYNAAKSNNADIVMGNVLFYDFDKKTNKHLYKTDKSIVNIICPGKKSFIELMRTNSFVPLICSYIYKREWLIQSKLKIQNILCEDELWTPIVICHAKRMLILDHDFYHYHERTDSTMQILNPEKRIASLFIICDQLIRFANSNYKNKELFSWLYVNIFQLYRKAFNKLYKLRDSTYVLPPHHLYIIFQIYHKLEKETRQICRQEYSQAKKELKKHLKLRLSPWFKIRHKPDLKQTLILIYNTMWDEPFPLLPEDVPRDCIITTDRRHLSDADAVVFHIPTLIYELETDLDKPEGQIWIAWCMECEEHLPIWKDSEFMNLFELRMSYHQYADIIYPYFKYNDLESMYNSIHLSDKINKSCMFISSSLNQSYRKEYVEELMKYTAIDSFGKLFNNSQIPNDEGRKTKLKYYSKYKFVIAFENSIALDYVTEKFFDPLLAGSIPIYLGAPNINEYAPGENSFIDVRMFENQRQLADFINYCYEDETSYSRFFNWKNQKPSLSFQEKIERQKINPFIRLCNEVKEKRYKTIKNKYL